MVRTAPLTERQQTVLEFIRDYQTKRGFPPSYEELRNHFGFASLNAVRDVLLALERKGYILRQPGRSRAIQLRDSQTTDFESTCNSTHNTDLLTIIGQGSSSNPMAAFLKPRGTLAIDARFMGLEGKHCFAAISPDDAMKGIGILRGDVLIVEQSDSFAHGAIMVCLDSTNLVVRQCSLEDGKYVLRPTTRGFSTIIVGVGQNTSVHLLGIVRGIVRKL